jgi:hypothetical protein
LKCHSRYSKAVDKCPSSQQGDISFIAPVYHHVAQHSPS